MLNCLARKVSCVWVENESLALERPFFGLNGDEKVLRYAPYTDASRNCHVVYIIVTMPPPTNVL